jgi:hypothetical protein
MTPPITWPDGKQFAFTVFDDTDWATLDNVRATYAFLRDCGMRTTKSCWVVRGAPARGAFTGQTCDDPDYLQWLLDLQSQGFEIAWHNCTWHGLPRAEIAAALDKFVKLFGHYPFSATNHAQNEEGVYWADHRLTGLHVLVYDLLTCFRHWGRFRGDLAGNKFFWGDLCKAHIKYMRNFIFQNVNTWQCCPFMPYHDPRRPYVNSWFASSNGRTVREFTRCISERNQDRLEAEGGVCIMYTHFACGFAKGNRIEPEFQRLIERLSKKNGWFVPVATLLDYLEQVRGRHEITPAERRHLERKWLFEKLRVGTV